MRHGLSFNATLELRCVTSGLERFGIKWDGVWLDGERSYDTYVIIDGVVSYHVPARDRAVERCFELHEQRGGGHAVP